MQYVSICFESFLFIALPIYCTVSNSVLRLWKLATIFNSDVFSAARLVPVCLPTHRRYGFLLFTTSRSPFRLMRETFFHKPITQNEKDGEVEEGKF